MARIEKTSRQGTRYIEDEHGEIIEKECGGECGEMKSTHSFYGNKGRLADRKSKCKSCEKVCRREHYKNNKEWKREAMRDHYGNNKELYRAANHRRRAIKRELTAIFTGKDHFKLKSGGCVLTGEFEDVHSDHFISLATGHGGTYAANMIGLVGYLNLSKGDRNPFEWIQTRKDADKAKFDALVKRLADANGLTVDEYREFVYWCYDNPRSDEQIKADNEYYGYKKPSIEIWQEQRQGRLNKPSLFTPTVPYYTGSALIQVGRNSPITIRKGSLHMSFLTFAAGLQLIGGAIMSVGYFPQIVRTIKTKSVEDIDTAYYPFVFGGLALFEVYAIALFAETGSGLMFLFTNSLSVLLAGTMLVFSIVYRSNNKKK